jgi:hypothetical protein
LAIFTFVSKPSGIPLLPPPSSEEIEAFLLPFDVLVGTIGARVDRSTGREMGREVKRGGEGEAQRDRRDREKK